ncbi:MAG: hypothetical protein HYZ75_02035 [Elusimicrobia bacterium]|nr:hypothetical protein [Elusimicrobiota bacterium]
MFETLRRSLAGAGAVLVLTCSASAVVGISTQFVDVEFDRLKPGGVYNLREISGVPYSIKNRGGLPVEVFLEVQSPSTSAVTSPYEALPDPSWFELSPASLRIEPNSIGFADIIVRIPDDPALKGRHFQAKIWARTNKFGVYSLGVDSRLRFSIGPSPEAVERKALREAVVSLNYDLWPNALYVKAAKTGVVYDVKGEEKKSHLLTNRGEETLTLVPEAVGWPVGSLPLPSGGWETLPDLSWVKFEPAEIAVDALAVKEFKMRIENAPEALKGRKFAFLIALKLPNGMVVNATHRGFVTFAADDKISAPEAPEKK